MARILQSDGGSGLETRQELNAAILAVAQMCAEAAAPAVTYAYMWWIDTANSLVKQRTAANDAWVTKGAVLANGTILWYPSAIDFSQELASAIAMGSNKITGLADGSANGDAVHFGQFLSNLAAPGYQKLPNGEVLQFGSVTAGSGTTVTFPLAFAEAPHFIGVTITSSGAPAGPIFTAEATNIGTSSFAIYVSTQAISGGAWSAGSHIVSWFAISKLP